MNRLALALLAVLLPAPVATAQYSFRNLTVPAGTTVVDWYGVPALCMLVPKATTFASFEWRDPRWSPGPEVQLAVHCGAVWDNRPCAVGSGARIASYDVGSTYSPIPLVGIDPSGFSLRMYSSSNPLMLGMNRFNMNPTDFWVDYCPLMGKCGTCGVLGNDGPQYAAFVATLVLK